MNDEYLKTTLRKLGVGDMEIAPSSIIAASPPDKQGNAEVYNRCNEVMLGELQRQSLGSIFHVTGEMRAVSDPHHRQVCRIASRHYGAPIKMMAYIPADRKRTGRDIWNWNTRCWPPQSWQNHLDAFHLFASQETILYGLPSPEAMHFSLFGDQYVLLQEEHDHDAHVKRVWLLKSGTLRAALVPRVEKCFRSATEIPARLFQNFAGLLSDPLHLDALFQLKTREEIDRENFKLECEVFGTSLEEVLADLSTVGFIDYPDGAVRVTKSGIEFLSMFESK